MKNQKIFIAFGVIIFIILISLPGIYFYRKYRQSRDMLFQLPLSSPEQAKSILDKIREITQLPNDEVPEIVTIFDITKSGGQAFFAKGKNGDKLVIYKKAGLAILYDPIENQIVQMGPLILPTPTIPYYPNSSESASTVRKR